MIKEMLFSIHVRRYTLFTYEENVDEFRNTTFPGEPQDSIDNVNGGGSKQLARQFLKRLF